MTLDELKYKITRILEASSPEEPYGNVIAQINIVIDKSGEELLERIEEMRTELE